MYLVLRTSPQNQRRSHMLFSTMRWRRWSKPEGRALLPAWLFSRPDLARRGWRHSTALAWGAVAFCLLLIARKSLLRPYRPFDESTPTLEWADLLASNGKFRRTSCLHQCKLWQGSINCPIFGPTSSTTSLSMSFIMLLLTPTA